MCAAPEPYNAVDACSQGSLLFPFLSFPFLFFFLFFLSFSFFFCDLVFIPTGNDMTPVHECYDSGHGAILEHYIGVCSHFNTNNIHFIIILSSTTLFFLPSQFNFSLQIIQDQLRPPLNSVPWILLNGRHTNDYENLTTTLCNYQSPQNCPPGCFTLPVSFLFLSFFLNYFFAFFFLSHFVFSLFPRTLGVSPAPLNNHSNKPPGFTKKN